MTKPVTLLRVSVQMRSSLGSARALSSRNYWPHFVVGEPDQQAAILGPDNTLVEEHLGVCVWAGPAELQPGQAAELDVALPYSPEIYAKLTPGATFTIREGSKIVGSGRVLAHAGHASR